MCPFFRPRNIDTHTGDPGFICKDKDISTDARFTKYGSEPYCYKLCHLIDVKEEFGNDSDSKCHKLKPIPNVTNIPHSTSSSQIKHSFALGDLIHMLAFVWTIRTILQITDIGLT
ncbi:hypothetical protein SNE40_000345 [Patella caerulea]|uniref:Uncharacterized protein n=1 Tax=Patella caerulea TaxID=87958 RepID=A0AAN8Q248_PATCE